MSVGAKKHKQTENGTCMYTIYSLIELKKYADNIWHMDV
jgi:hypothetical protein